MEIVFESIGSSVPHKILKKKKKKKIVSGILQQVGERLIFNVKRSYNRKKIRRAFPSGSEEKLAAKKKKKEKPIYSQYYKTKVNAGQSSTRMKKDVKEIGKLFLRLKIVMTDLLQIQ